MDRSIPLTVSAADSLGISLDRINAVAGENGFCKGGSSVICEAEPLLFLEKFFAALLNGCSVWLASPDWGSARMSEVVSIINGSNPEPGSIMIPTGGTTGRLRFAVHSWETLSAAAHGFGEFFGEDGWHKTLCVLPTYHVSGLMQAVRVVTLGGRLVFGNAHHPNADLPAGFSPDGFFISLVPTQLRRLMDDGADDWLRAFRVIVIGGAALDVSLAARAFDARLPLAPCYGMTETAAMVCALKPEEFLAGMRGAGRALPHASISLDADSRVRVRAKSLCHAMMPSGDMDVSNGLLTRDIGAFDTDGVLHIKGRVDRVIVSGGQKIDPDEVEAAILATGLVSDTCVVGIRNPDWGESAVALYVGKMEDGGVEGELCAAVRATLSPVHVPKKWVKLAAIPRNAAGKPDMAAIRSAAERL